jgi:hypothetical protein
MKKTIFALILTLALAGSGTQAFAGNRISEMAVNEGGRHVAHCAQMHERGASHCLQMEMGMNAL